MNLQQGGGLFGVDQRLNSRSNVVFGPCGWFLWGYPWQTLLNLDESANHRAITAYSDCKQFLSVSNNS